MAATLDTHILLLACADGFSSTTHEELTKCVLVADRLPIATAPPLNAPLVGGIDGDGLDRASSVAGLPLDEIGSLLF